MNSAPHCVVDKHRNSSRWHNAAATVLAIGSLLCSCTEVPVQPVYNYDQPLNSLPASLQGIEDDRANFRHAFCEINRQAGSSLPDYRSCDDALTRYRDEQAAHLEPIDRSETLWIANIVLVPGSGWACARASVEEQALLQHARKLGYRIDVAPIDGQASTVRNGRLLSNYILDESKIPGYSPIVLIGFSKGVPDILEALARSEALRERVIAVISVAGAVGGSPLADSYFRRSMGAHESLTGNQPQDSSCNEDGKDAMQSLKTQVRRGWLDNNPLPPGIRYYSLVSLPKADNISSALQSDHRKLSRIDTRNDGQFLYYDQILPNSKLLAFLNADHLAATIPQPRQPAQAAANGLTESDFPREVLLESILRYLERDIRENKLPVNRETARASAP